MRNKRETRPWGRYEVISCDVAFQVKRISVLPGQRLSYQKHRFRAEHWFVVAGAGVVTLDDVDQPIGPQTTVDIPAGVAHRVENRGTDELVFVEVQTGSYFGEDDIERIADDYGRAGPQLGESALASASEALR